MNNVDTEAGFRVYHSCCHCGHDISTQWPAPDPLECPKCGQRFVIKESYYPPGASVYEPVPNNIQSLETVRRDIAAAIVEPIQDHFGEILETSNANNEKYASISMRNVTPHEFRVFVSAFCKGFSAGLSEQP